LLRYQVRAILSLGKFKLTMVVHTENQETANKPWVMKYIERDDKTKSTA